MNMYIACNTIEKELAPLSEATVQMIDNAVNKRTTCVDEQGQLKGMLFNRKCQQVGTYKQYLSRNV